MMEVGVLCDSFDEDDIEDLQAELQLIEGPTLSYFQNVKQSQPIIHFNSADMIRILLQNQQMDIKLVGKQQDSLYQSFFYLLLLLGLQQKRCYPHLNTLIKQQFYKPNIFSQSKTQHHLHQQSIMLQKCLNYFQEIGNGKKIQQYIIQQPIFQQACIIMLKNSIQVDNEQSTYQQLARKFNIEMKIMKINEESQCYSFNAHHQYHIYKEQEYYFIALSQLKEDIYSKYDNQSIRSQQSGFHQIVATISQHSTPKFKNSQVKFRKKSHKNSFGGDLQIIQYRDLLQQKYQKMVNINNAHTFSEYFDGNEVQSCAQNLQDNKFLKKNSFQDIIEGQKVDKNEMKGSTTITPTQTFNSFNNERRKDRKISSSQIISYNDFNFKKQKDENNKLSKLQYLQEEDDERPNAYNSLVVVKEDPIIPSTKMRTSIIQQRQLQRIQQFQSSQRQSTHPDQFSQPSDVQAEISENQTQVKLKDRKYSYFTQQMASSKSKKAKEIQSSNYVFKIPKNLHKNQELMLSSAGQNAYSRNRFHQNNLRFSQIQPSQQSAPQNTNMHKKNRQSSKKLQPLKLSSGIFSYIIKFQPQHWLKKQTIYHFMDGTTQRCVFQKSYGKKPSIINNEDKIFAKESFGSSMLSNNKFYDYSHNNMPPYSTTSIQRNSMKNVNPYEMNETSFLKNRKQTCSSVIIAQPSIENKNVQNNRQGQFTTYRSLQNIHRNPIIQNLKPKSPKISFNYISSNQLNKPKQGESLNISSSSNLPLYKPPATLLSPYQPSSSSRLHFVSPNFHRNQTIINKSLHYLPFAKSESILSNLK